MTLRINDVAPDFTAETTQGEISFHEWLGDSWGILIYRLWRGVVYTVCTGNHNRTVNTKT